MIKRIAIIAAAAITGIIFITKIFSLPPEKLLLVPLGVIGLSLVFFSRGILIFLTALCLIFTQSIFPALTPFALNFRWVFFFLFLLHVFGDIFLGRTARGIKSFDIWAMGFIIYAFLSVSYSPYPKLTLERSTTIFALYISVFWIIWKYAYEQGPEKVVRLLLRLVMFVVLAGYILIFIGPHRPFMAGRFTGLFSNPNGLGVVYALFLPLSFWQFSETGKKSALLLFVLILIGVFLSAARGSINAALMGLGYFIYMRRRKYRPVLLFSSVSFIMILYWIIETALKETFKTYIRAESLPVLGGRLEFWQVAIKLIIEKPIFGHGFGVEEKIFGLKKLMPLGQAGFYLHNCYLGILLQLGILGFIFLFGPLFTLLFKELSLKHESGRPNLRHALQGSLIAGLISCFFESWIYSVGGAQAFPFWVMVMLLVFYRYADKPKDTAILMTT